MVVISMVSILKELHGIMVIFYFNIENALLDDPIPKMLYPEMPHVWFRPKKIEKDKDKKDMYDCPVYRTSKRAGELLTTGQSTNFLIHICNFLLIKHYRILRINILKNIGL